MRIIAGTHKGRVIQAVPGKGTRPTTDRVREAWASTITTLAPGDGLARLRVLDAFAGSGALGLELLSRGAETCHFTEQNRKALITLRANIKALGFSPDRARVSAVDSLSPRLPALVDGSGPFDLVVLDPPYEVPQKKVEGLLATLAEHDLLALQTLISYEHARLSDNSMDGLEVNCSEGSLSLVLVRRKSYGTITLDYYRCGR